MTEFTPNKEKTLNIQVPDEAQRALLDELIWEFHRGNIKLRGTSRGSDDIFSVTYVTLDKSKQPEGSK